MENNIGKLNAIFMQNVIDILKCNNGHKIIKEYVSLITKNKDLLKEYKIFDLIENINETDNAKDYIYESIKCLDNINKTELKKLNETVGKFMIDNNIKSKYEIKNNEMYEMIDSLIFSENNINSISEKIDKVNKLNKLIVEHSKSNKSIENNNSMIVEDVDVFIKLVIDKFNEKYSDKLNESDKELFNTIISKNKEDEKENLFEEHRKECLSLTNNFLKESIDNDTKSKLLDVKEKLLEQKYNSESYFEDILSFVDLKNTLSE